MHHTTLADLSIVYISIQIAALERALSKFGIIELSRTGRIAINRGEYLFGRQGMPSESEDGKNSVKSIRIGEGGQDGVYGGSYVEGILYHLPMIDSFVSNSFN